MDKPDKATVLNLSYHLGHFDLTSVASLCSIALEKTVYVDELTETTLEIFQKIYLGSIGIALRNPVSFTTKILSAINETQRKELEQSLVISKVKYGGTV